MANGYFHRRGSRFGAGFLKVAREGFGGIGFARLAWRRRLTDGSPRAPDR
jgi:hypothetical protein